MKDEDVVCYCSRVTKGQIRQAMDQGAKSLKDIQRMTGACTLHLCKEFSPKGT